MNKKRLPSSSFKKPTFRKAKRRLEAILHLQSLTYGEDEFAAFIDAIDSLPIPHWKRLVLLHYYDPDGEREVTSRYPLLSVPARKKPHPLESRNRPEARYWRISALEGRIRGTIPQTQETRRFFTLWLRGITTGFAQSFSQVAWKESVEELHRRYQESGDREAVGLVAGATKGSPARPAWVREAIEKATDEGRRIPQQGSGRNVTRSLEEWRKQRKEASRRYREKIETVKIQIKDDFLAEQNKVLKLPRVQNPRHEIAARKREVLQRYLASKNSHDRAAAKQILKELKKAKSE